MKADIGRWMAASVYKEFKTKLEAKGVQVYIEGQRRQTSEAPIWVELRFDGPYLRAVDSKIWHARIEFNVLVAALAERNIYSIHTVCGWVAEVFLRRFPIFKFGGLTQDDGSYVGCMKAVEDNREWLKISHFGIIETKTMLMQSTVELGYVMEFTP